MKTRNNKYDRVNWGLLELLTNPINPSDLRDCDFRYDPIADVIYTESTTENARMTYIAKAEGLDIYKIGRTTNLDRRAKQLRRQNPYSLLNLTMIAYCPRDLETAILISSQSGRRFPTPYETTKELVSLPFKTILKLIKKCGFIILEEGAKLPESLTLTRRITYNPYNGKANGWSDSYSSVLGK